MPLPINDLLRDISKIDQGDLLSPWKWLLSEPMEIIIISNFGDLFLQDNSGRIYWLQTDGGVLEQVAKNSDEFLKLFSDEEIVDNWLLPVLIEKLLDAGMTLKENEVYSPLKMAVLGGTYEIDNFRPADLSVHLQFTGLISEQIKYLPDGTPVNIKFVNLK